MARKAQTQTIDPSAITALVAALTQSGAINPAALAALTGGKGKATKDDGELTEAQKWERIMTGVRSFVQDRGRNAGSVVMRIKGDIHFSDDSTTTKGVAFGLSALSDDPALAVVKYSVSAKGNVYASSPKLTAVTEADIRQYGEWLEIAVNGATPAPRATASGSDPVAAIRAATSRADIARILKAHGHGLPKHAARMRLDTLQDRAVEMLQG